MLKRNIMLVAFGVIVVSFFLPFFNFIIAISGVNLVLGIRASDIFGLNSSSVYDLKPDIFAIIALIAAIGGFTIIFLERIIASIIALICGCVGVLSLIILSLNATKWMGGSLLQRMVSYEIGFYICILLFAAVAVIAITILVEKRKTQTIQSEKNLENEYSQVYSPAYSREPIEYRSEKATSESSSYERPEYTPPEGSPTESRKSEPGINIKSTLKTRDSSDIESTEAEVGAKKYYSKPDDLD